MIQARGISKTFRSGGRTIAALEGVDLDIGAGEIFCLLGTNGAGKTTLLRILAGLLLPGSGTVKVAGGDPAELRGKVGIVLADVPGLYPSLTGRQNLRFWGSLYGQTGARINQLLELLEVTEADHPVQELSSGMRQRVALARGLLHDPEVLFLDEPTRSLDPNAAASFLALIRDRLKGKTVVLSTQRLEEPRILAAPVAILHRGRRRIAGTLEEVQRQAGCPSGDLAEVFACFTRDES